MKKKTVTIGVLLLAINSFGQADTLSYSISGKEKYEFDYRTSKVIKADKTKKYQNFKFKLKNSDILLIDLFDYIKSDTLYLLYRYVTVYYRSGYIEKLYFNSNDNTLTIDGSLVKKVIIHKPELK